MTCTVIHFGGSKPVAIWKPFHLKRLLSSKENVRDVLEVHPLLHSIYDILGVSQHQKALRLATGVDISPG